MWSQEKKTVVHVTVARELVEEAFVGAEGVAVPKHGSPPPISGARVDNPAAALVEDVAMWIQVLLPRKRVAARAYKRTRTGVQVVVVLAGASGP